MVLAIHLSFIDLIQLGYITDLSKVIAKNGPHRHAGSLARFRTLPAALFDTLPATLPIISSLYG